MEEQFEDVTTVDSRDAFEEFLRIQAEDGIYPYPPSEIEIRVTRETAPATAPHPLSHMWELQDGLNKRVGVDWRMYQDDPSLQQEWVMKYIQALQQELAELTDCFPWKHWARYQKRDLQNARVEVVDAFHFLISIAQVLGLSADGVYQAYLKKNKINNSRQDANGYSTKNEDDCRSI